jgi:hypothetical protein
VVPLLLGEERIAVSSDILRAITNF